MISDLVSKILRNSSEISFGSLFESICFRHSYENSSRRNSTSNSSFSKSYSNCARHCISNFSRRSTDIISKTCCRHYSIFFLNFFSKFTWRFFQKPLKIFLEVFQNFSRIISGDFQVTLPGVQQKFCQQ